jgi:hypothetical protein
MVALTYNRSEDVALLPNSIASHSAMITVMV